MRFLSLFAGIGGFDLGLERAGFECAGQVEINTFCQKVLAKHWPNVKRISDIREVKGDEFGTIDLVCGGFPCQPFSTAGKRKGADDNRYLWPEMLRVIDAVKPSYVIGENVVGILNVAFDKVCADLEEKGYEVLSFIIPACSVNAPHRRDRVWFLSYSQSIGNGRTTGTLAQETKKSKSEINGLFPNRKSENGISWHNFPAQPSLCGRNDGVSNRVDRVKALGNAVVPQIVEIIGKAIKAGALHYSLQHQLCGSASSEASPAKSRRKRRIMFELLQKYCGFRMHDEREESGVCACNKDGQFEMTNMGLCKKEACPAMKEAAAESAGLRTTSAQQTQAVISHAPCAVFDTCNETIKSCCCAGLPVCYKTTDY
jgi:DNA (cytosine-5)-methyltransferase 1